MNVLRLQKPKLKQPLIFKVLFCVSWATDLLRKNVELHVMFYIPGAHIFVYKRQEIKLIQNKQQQKITAVYTVPPCSDHVFWTKQ